MVSTISSPGRGLVAAVTGGLVSGAADLIYAFTAYGAIGVRPIEILHSIASGWLGREAYSGGATSAALGFLSHFLITCMAAGLYVFASKQIPVLLRKPVLSGAAFGIGMFVGMNYVVVPLSAAVSAGPRGVFLVLGILVHMFLVGVPIALIARRVLAPR